MLAQYLHCIRFTNAIPVLLTLVRDIAARYPDDDATPRLLRVIALKVVRRQREN